MSWKDWDGQSYRSRDPTRLLMNLLRKVFDTKNPSNETCVGPVLTDIPPHCLQVTPQEDKVPDWELASEVTAFMQDTTGTPIPNIVPDSLGVYLGTERGRGVAPPTGERFAAAAAAAASAQGGAPLAIGSDGAMLGFGDELEGPAFGKVASLSRMSEDGMSPASTPGRGTSQRGTPPRSFKRWVV